VSEDASEQTALLASRLESRSDVPQSGISEAGMKNKLLYFSSGSAKQKFPMSSEARQEIGGRKKFPLGNLFVTKSCRARR